MMHHAASAGVAFAKRAMDGGNGADYAELPGWAFLIIALSILVFLPAFLFTGYTLNSIYPVLAMVEDTNPPAYEPVSLTEEVDGSPPTTTAGEPKLVTSSLRSVNRLLYSVGGWRANFRGIMCAIAIAVATSVVGGIFTAVPFVPGFVGTLLATLALIQLHTAWVHIVMGTPNPLPFWRRLPPFRKTFEATSIPVAIYWLATTLSTVGPTLLSGALGLPLWDPKHPNEIPEYKPGMAWKSFVVSIVSLACTILIVIPAHVVLVRVQASLLPPDEDAIIPFDRSFEGTVEPAIVGGKGYATWKDALKTFRRGSWIRLYVLYAKIFVANLALSILFAAVLIPEVMLLSNHAKKPN